MMLTCSPRRAVTTAAIALVAAMVLAGPANAADVVSYRATGGTFHAVPSGAGTVVSDGLGGGKVFALTSTGAATRTIISPVVHRLQVRLRGRTCGKVAPLAVVELDGREIARMAVSTSTYATLKVPVQLSNEEHELAVRMPNGGTVGTCARTLYVADVTGYSATTYNTGKAGTVCMGTDRGEAYGPALADLSTTALGDAPSGAYYEVGEPTGAHAGRTPKGIMFIVHGGGWVYVGESAVIKDRPHADRWRARGWRTVNVTYSPCGDSIQDVLDFHDRVVATYGHDVKVCAYGQSAGAHLSLMLASYRDLHCVISAGGPTDFNGFATQAANSLWGPSATGPKSVYHLVASAFGESDPGLTVAQNLDAASPITRAPRITARVLQAVADKDSLIPRQQMTDMQAALARVPARAGTYNVATVLTGKGGNNQNWVHAVVSASELARFHALELDVAAG